MAGAFVADKLSFRPRGQLLREQLVVGREIVEITGSVFNNVAGSHGNLGVEHIRGELLIQLPNAISTAFDAKAKVFIVMLEIELSGLIKVRRPAVEEFHRCRLQLGPT
jgi:hypothetical protein